MDLNRLKNARSADSILLKLGPFIPFQERPKSQGRISGCITPGATGKREGSMQHSGAVKRMKNGEPGEVTVLVPIFTGIGVVCDTMCDLFGQNFNNGTDSSPPPQEPVW